MKNTIETIQSLRQKGYKVRVIHRQDEKSDNEEVNVARLAQDGNPNITEIDVTTPDKSITVTGVSYRAKGDFYHRKLGNRIALQRALELLQKEISFRQ